MPQIKLSFDQQNIHKQNVNSTNMKKEKTKRSDTNKISGKKRDNQYVKDQLSLNKQQSKKIKIESEYYLQQKEMQRHMKEG